MSLVAEITQAFEQERKAGRKATTFDDVPGTYDAMTPQWLTRVICRDAPGAVVAGFSFGEKDEGSSSRRRLFLSYNDVGRAAGLPETVFCKAAEELGSRIMLGAAGTAKAEVNFFNRIRNRLDIEAPVAIHAAFDPKTYAYIVMMKDIGGEVEFCDEATSVNWERAVSLVSLLAAFHARFHESPELGSDTIPYMTWSVFWNNMLENSRGWEESSRRAIDLCAHFVAPRLLQRRAEIWPATSASVARHDVLPKTLTHSDTHLKNWYVVPENRMGLADWQILTIGHWSRDLIYALGTALRVEDRRAWLPELLRIYVEEMKAHGVAGITVDEAMLNCRQQVFTALAFWTTTLVPALGMPPLQPAATTYTFLERLLATVDDLDCLDSF